MIRTEKIEDISNKMKKFFFATAQFRNRVLMSRASRISTQALRPVSNELIPSSGNRRFCSSLPNSSSNEEHDNTTRLLDKPILVKEDVRKVDRMSSHDVPIIPLDDLPLFPGSYKKIYIYDGALQDLIRKKFDSGQRQVGLFVKKNKNILEGKSTSLDSIYSVGTLATIESLLKIGPVLKVDVIARSRIRIVEPIVEENDVATEPSSMPHISHINSRRQSVKRDEANQQAPVEPSDVIYAKAEELLCDQPEVFEDVSVLKAAVYKAIQEVWQSKVPLAFGNPTIVWSLPTLNEISSLCDLAGEMCKNVEKEDLQRLIEESDIKRRLEIAFEVLTKEKLNFKMDEQVQKTFEKTHKEFYLRTKLNTIMKELGMDKDAKQVQIDKVEHKLKGLTVPEHAMNVINEEISKLRCLDVNSSEFSVTRSYLDWLSDIPWGKCSEENLDLERAAKILDEDHYGMKDVKERILEFMAVRILKKSSAGKILCLHGPPGIGKTSIAKSIAHVLGRKYYRFSVGGMTDVAEIKGHRRTYVGAMPGKIIQCLKRVEKENPLVLIDEIDKIGRGNYQGDPSSALLELLDPEQNANFLDHYLDVPVDLSKVLFICTANTTDTIPDALSDRLEMIEVSGYVAEEKIKIAENYLIPQSRKACALSEDQLVIKKDSIEAMIKSYCRESGVRNLQKHIEKVFRKAAFKIASKVNPKAAEDNETKEKNVEKTDAIVVDKSNLGKYLGLEKFTSDRLYELTPPGIVMGLAWTSMGGCALYIETSLSKRLAKSPVKSDGDSKETKVEQSSDGSLETTGQLGDVMKESTRASYTVAKNTIMKRDTDNDFLERAHIHLHVPEGATPKDGPSAGVTITTALVSLALNKSTKQDIAMTGEISLTGKILPVGGIREKVIAAKRAGIKSVILPEENRKDFEDLPEFIRDDVEIHFVSHYDQVFDLLFTEKAEETLA